MEKDRKQNRGERERKVNRRKGKMEEKRLTQRGQNNPSPTFCDENVEKNQISNINHDPIHVQMLATEASATSTIEPPGSDDDMSGEEVGNRSNLRTRTSRVRKDRRRNLLWNSGYYNQEDTKETKLKRRKQTQMITNEGERNKGKELCPSFFSICPPLNPLRLTHPSVKKSSCFQRQLRA